MKSLSQHIENPIVVGGGESDGRYLTIIFTQEAAARFAPHTKVYLSWRHIQKNVKGYNVFTEIPREDTDELTAEEQPPAWFIHYPKALLHEGDAIATIELVDEISVAASTTFSIHILADPWEGTEWFEEDDLSEFKEAMIKADNRYHELRTEIQQIIEMFDITDFVDKNHDGIPDDEQDLPDDPTENIETDDGLYIINWTGGE